MNTLKTHRSCLAALLLLSPLVGAQGLSGLGKGLTGAKKGTGTAKVKLPPIKDTKPKTPPEPPGPEEPAPNPKPTPREPTPPRMPPRTPERLRNGGEITRRANRTPQDVSMPNRGGGTMAIHHGLSGGRRVDVRRADGSHVVAEGSRRGHLERPYMFHGHVFAHRTYYVNGRVYDRFYGRYEYHGAVLAVYAPARYYPGAFYGWAYNTQWAAVPYGWGWAGNPWYAYYGAYFTPYPVYANASFWLTDYLVSQSLAGAYQAQLDAQIALSPPMLPGQVVLTTDVKQAIQQEVQGQLALEYKEAQDNSQNADFNAQSGSIAGLLADKAPHMFVVGADLDLVDTTGQECAVTEGDVLRFDPAVPQSDGSATLMVMASRGGLECRRSLSVQVPYAELQEMQNHMRETVDQGLAALQAHQGGLPAPPASAMAPATLANFENGAPAPDPAVANEIDLQYQDASKAEQEALSPGSDPAGASQPPVANLGMTPDQVVGVMGQPNTVVDLGSKLIYLYPNRKIVFKDGKVNDIE